MHAMACVEPPDAHDASPFVPSHASLELLRDASRACRGCPLYARATQTVFGEGTRGATIFIVGEQPGDREDVEGRPFVGPAGAVLDAALARANVSRVETYVTNAVKHFKWSPRGKRRMHTKPDTREVGACRPWLDAELRAVGPRVVVCLGATAAQAFLGSRFRITAAFGQTLEGPGGIPLVVTYHPSAILRMQTHEEREAGRAALVAALARAKALVREPPESAAGRGRTPPLPRANRRSGRGA